MTHTTTPYAHAQHVGCVPYYRRRRANGTVRVFFNRGSLPFTLDVDPEVANRLVVGRLYTIEQIHAAPAAKYSGTNVLPDSVDGVETDLHTAPDRSNA